MTILRASEWRMTAVSAWPLTPMMKSPSWPGASTPTWEAGFAVVLGSEGAHNR